MKQKLIWSIGLYTVDFMVYDEDKGAIKSVVDLPPIFPNGDVEKYIAFHYEYDIRMESGLITVYMGLDCRDPNYVGKFMSDIAKEFNFNEQRILNIEELKVGAKDLHTLIREFAQQKEF